MTINRQLKATLHETKVLAEAGASEGARRATADAPASAAKNFPGAAATEVVARAGRRFFPLSEKLRILREVDGCTRPGDVGAVLRRERVYSSTLHTWRQQRKAAERGALAPQKRGPKPAPDRDQVQQIAELTRDNDRLKSRLDKALFVIEVQKKLAALLGRPLDDNGEPI